MRFIQTFLPALREAPGQGARIVYIRAHYAPNYVVLITWYLTPKRRGTDLTCLPTYQTTYQPPTLHVLSIPRLQTNSSPENRPIHPSCSSMHQVRASCKSRASLACYRIRHRGVPLGGKSRHSPHATDTSVSLTAAPSGCEGCRGAPAQARAGARRAQRLHRWRFSPRCTPEQSLQWKPWARRFDWSLLPSRSRFRPSTLLPCARRSLTSSSPRTLPRSRAARVRSV